MRVITGSARGRRLKTPEGLDIRPFRGNGYPERAGRMIGGKDSRHLFGAQGDFPDIPARFYRRVSGSGPFGKQAGTVGRKSF